MQFSTKSTSLNEVHINFFFKAFVVLSMFLCLWLFRPVNSLPILTKSIESAEPVEVVEGKDSLPATTKIQKINIIEESPISKSAEEEMASGRFLLETQIRPGVSKLEIYRNLIIRGGIFISLDTNKTYHLLDNESLRTPLSEVDEFKLPIKGYAFHRPRQIDPRDFRYLGRNIPKGEVVFLVMPNNFESSILTEMEALLPLPLSSYAEGLVNLDLSRNGHLNFTLISVVKNAGATQIINRAFRGV
jgi:hypothetical protein